MEEATTRLEKIISEMKTADEINASQTAVDTETGKVVKKKKGTILKTSSATVKALDAEWKKMAFLSSRTQFQLRYEKVKIVYIPSLSFLHLLNDVYCVQNQLFEEIWRHHNVGPEGRWPSITNVGQDIPDCPFQLVNTWIIPDMLNGIPALKGQVWGSEQVRIYLSVFVLRGI